jgi:chitin disaccharide deacetylase
MKYLIVNADDYNLTSSVSKGILKAARDGIVTSTTVMVNLPVDETLPLLFSLPNLGIGLHLNLTCGQPVTKAERVSSLLKDGSFSRQQIPFFRKSEVEIELTSQLEKALSLGLPLTHLDGHHHIQGNQEIRDIFVKLAKNYCLPVRWPNPETKIAFLENNISTISSFIGDFYDEPAINEDNLLKKLACLSHGITEIMCHPAYQDEELTKISKYTFQREKELTTLTCEKIKEFISQQGIILTNYKIFQDKEVIKLGVSNFEPDCSPC